VLGASTFSYAATPAVVSKPPPYPHAESLLEQGVALFLVLFLVALLLLALVLLLCALFEHAERRLSER
jgi:hypothetical protein